MDRIIREKERKHLTGVAKSTWWRWQRDGIAPKPVKLGPSAVGWPESAIREWIKGRPGGAGKPATPAEARGA